MAYTVSQAIPTLDRYLGITEVDKEIIEDTNNRGFILTLKSGEKAVIYVYPLVHKQDNTKNYFDTRDSGARERGIAWNYAITNNLKYFCLGVNDSVDKYVDYAFSLECDERTVEVISGTKNGDRNGPGNQIIIPNAYVPSKSFERIANKLGVYIAAIHKDKLHEYLVTYDNRPYMVDRAKVEILLEAEEIGLENDDNEDSSTYLSSYEDDVQDLRKKEMNVSKSCLDIKLEPRKNTIHPFNCIIYGAPGTGKTYSTAEYALAIIEGRDVDKSRKTVEQRKAVMDTFKNYVRKGQIVFTTFHQSYGYEEFIQGFRPDPNANHISFITVDGRFKKIADTALNDNKNNYVIIIDEINRANISKVFGELITLIEGDKRWGEINETCVTLQSGNVFTVPNNLYIVGTMNSADKSISLIDAALRRRFEFIEQYPDATLVDDPTLRDVLQKMNGLLADSFESSDLLIGHSYFIGRTQEDLCKILNNSIIPLLYEYFYDNKRKIIGVLTQALHGLNVEIKDEKISRVYVMKVDG